MRITLPADGHTVGNDRDWPEIEKALFGEGLVDSSWKNDVTASFEDPAGSFRVWVHPLDPEKRESEVYSTRFEVVTPAAEKASFRSDSLEETLFWLRPRKETLLGLHSQEVKKW